MAGEDTTDDVSTDTDADGTDQPKPSQGKVLREKLETTLTRNAELEGKLLIHESGLGHLSERQRRAVIREAQEDGKDLTVDLLKEVAKDLGFGQGGAPPNENGNGDGGNDDGRNAGDDDTDEPLNSMDAIDRAARRAVPVDDPGSFEAKIKAAKSQGEVEALIRSDGYKVGIVHEMDTQ